jgi:putative phage-type endonuclease
MTEESAACQVESVIQGSGAWLAARAGMITASRMADMMAKGQGIVRDKYKCQLAAERLTGIPIANGFITPAMKRGTELEPEARYLYCIQNAADVVEVPFVKHPTIENALASPDGLIGGDGLIEIKCPDLSTHIGYLLDRKVPNGYLLQMMWQMACTGRAYCDFASYCPDLLPRLRLLVIRVDRDDGQIMALENAAIQFNEEIEALVTKLKEI